MIRRDVNLRLIHGDCLEKMKEVEDRSVQLILTDLPYAVTANKLDILIPFEPMWEQFNRVIKDDGCIVLFAQGLFYVDLVNSNREMFRYDLMWDKVLTTGFLNAPKMPLRQHEQIAVFYKRQPKYNPQFTKGNPCHDQGTKFLQKEVVNNNYGEYHATVREKTENKHPTSIVRFQKPHPSVALHRTEKPVALLEWLIKTYTDEGDTVMDCTAGSFSCGVAAVRTLRHFIGIEKDDNYYKLGSERVMRERDDYLL